MADAPLKPCPTIAAELTAIDARLRSVPTQSECSEAVNDLLRFMDKNAPALIDALTRPDPAPTGEVTQGDNEQTVLLTEWLIRADFFDEDGSPDHQRLIAAFGSLADQAFRNHRLRSTAPLEAEIARLREALEEAEEVFALVEHPALTDPDYHSEIYELGARIGFGALMSGASAEWRKSAIVAGSEFVSGPCQATVTRVLAIIRLALSPDGDASEGGGL